MVNHIINIFGSHIGIGYSMTLVVHSRRQLNIAHSAHLLMSITYGLWYPLSMGMRATICICQLYHHPLYVTGFGLEDIETCERLFSSSNGLAPVTRYASAFHRHQAIDLFAEQWDTDKYQELCKFYYLNTSGTC